MITDTNKPMAELSANDELEITKNPAISATEVVHSATPTVEKAYLTALIASSSRSRRARKYLLMKWIVSSTTIPSVMAATTDSPRPTSPSTRPHMPNAMPAGAILGMSDSRP